LAIKKKPSWGSALPAYSLPHNHLTIKMADGQCGEFDMTPYMESEFFSALKNDDYFRQVRLFLKEQVGPMDRIWGLTRLLRD
jgi:hypothetical protein